MLIMMNSDVFFRFMMYWLLSGGISCWNVSGLIILSSMCGIDRFIVSFVFVSFFGIDSSVLCIIFVRYVLEFIVIVMIVVVRLLMWICVSNGNVKYRNIICMMIGVLWINLI